MNLTWKPIETAPKDGTFILACGPEYSEHPRHDAENPSRYHPMTVAYTSYHPNAKGQKAWRDHYGHKWQHLTHWTPLPVDPRSMMNVHLEHT